MGDAPAGQVDLEHPPRDAVIPALRGAVKLEVATLAGLIGAQLEVDARLVTPRARFIEDLNADPIRITDLMLALEEQFEIEISNDDAARLRTFDDVVGYLVTRGYSP